MAKKADSSWGGLRRKSSSLRRGLDDLVKEIQDSCSIPSADTISAYAVVSSEMEAWTKAAGRVLPLCEDVLESLKRRSAEQSEVLDESIARTFRNSGLEVFGEAGLMVVNGIVHVETDLKKGVVRVNGSLAPEVIPGSILTLVQAELDRLKKVFTPPEKFLDLLLRAYESELRSGNKEFGAQVQTAALFWQLAILKQSPQFRLNPSTENFREYPKEVFRADLFGLLKSNVSEIQGKRFHFSSGSDTTGAVFILVPHLGRTAHLGRIWFEQRAK